MAVKISCSLNQRHMQRFGVLYNKRLDNLMYIHEIAGVSFSCITRSFISCGRLLGGMIAYWLSIISLMLSEAVLSTN